MALILLIDDDTENCEIVRELLEGAGHEVFIAHNWVNGTVLLCQHQPDLVLVDVRMPGLEGPQGLEILREDTSFKLPKIAFFSGVDEQELQRLCQAHQVDGYIQKGRADRLISSVEALLQD